MTVELEKSDIEDILAVAKKKRIDLKKYNDIEKVVSRCNMLIADKNLKDTVTAHSKYEDASGNKGSSPGGFMIQINKKLKAAAGCSVTTITEPEKMNVITLARNVIPVVIKNGEATIQERKVIKTKVYDFVDTVKAYMSQDLYNQVT